MLTIVCVIGAGYVIAAVYVRKLCFGTIPFCPQSLVGGVVVLDFLWQAV
jgi:hypothetical protein